MEELEKWQLINAAETKKELGDAILEIADNDMIQGRARKWSAVDQNVHLDRLLNNELYPANTLTRNYGIRRQALYLKYYKEV